MELNVSAALEYKWDDVKRIARADLLQPGGSWHPTDCSAIRSLLIIVPFKDREAHLPVFLAHMHPILQRQQASYRILVIEQVKKLRIYY